MNNRINFNDYGYQEDDYINSLLIKKNKINNRENIYGMYEGYIKGNMFKNLYNQYKNYNPESLIPNNEQEELLLNMNQTCFAAHDLRLYLDINPNDTNMIYMYNSFIDQANKTKKEYEMKYGILCESSLSDNNIFSWQVSEWPWEMGDK